MEESTEGPIIRLMKVVFAIIAVVSVVFVFYNIGIHTDSQDIEASVSLEESL